MDKRESTQPTAKRPQRQSSRAERSPRTPRPGSPAQPEGHLGREDHTPPPTNPSRTAAERFAVAVRGPLLALVINLALVIVKAIGGVVSGSAALLADAGHSGADVANNLFVLGSLVYSRRPADETHPYGHDRAEVLAAIGSAYVLAAASFFFGWDSIQKLIHGTPTPSPLAIYIAAGTLVVKLILVRIEMAIARNVTSQAVLADARDSLSDVLSSFVVIVGVLGARLGFPRLDGLAGIAIALLILYTAIQVGLTAGNELLDPNLNHDLLARVETAAATVGGVDQVRAVTGRAHGSDFLVEVSIAVDPQMSVARGVQIAEAVREAIYGAVPEVGDAMVELNTDHAARLRRRLR